MSQSLRTHVTFRSSAFDTSRQKAYFINPDNFGDDLALWLMRELRSRGVEIVGELGQEDHGWYFTLRSGGVEHDFVVGWRDGDEWLGWLERRVGLMGSLLGARRSRIESAAVLEIDRVLSASGRIREVRWHFEKDFMAGREELGRAKPEVGLT